MTDRTPPPWEPPIAGTEAEHLFGALDRLRATFRWKADGLDSAGLDTRVGASTLTLGALLKHLALVEDDVSTRRLPGPRSRGLGAVRPEVARLGVRQRSAGRARPSCTACRTEPSSGPATVSRRRSPPAGWTRRSSSAMPDGRHLSLRRLVCDLIEEYGRHTGHADLMREGVDGRVGEDPPADWRPSVAPAG